AVVQNTDFPRALASGPECEELAGVVVVDEERAGLGIRLADGRRHEGLEDVLQRLERCHLTREAKEELELAQLLGLLDTRQLRHGLGPTAPATPGPCLRAPELPPDGAARPPARGPRVPEHPTRAAP